VSLPFFWEHRVVCLVVEVPIMSLWRGRQEHRYVIGNVFITLAQVALTFAVVLLWLFG
jgi:hypothetical protein